MNSLETLNAPELQAVLAKQREIMADLDVVLPPDEELFDKGCSAWAKVQFFDKIIKAEREDGRV